jgi:quinol monooxygenase YgiN
VSEPVLVHVRLQPAEGRHEEVEAVLRTGIAAVHQEDGCLLYSLHRDDDGNFVVLEKWESLEHLQVHALGPAVGGLSQGLDGLLARPMEVTGLLPVPVGHAAKGAL